MDDTPWMASEERDFWGKKVIVIRCYEEGRLKRIADTWDPTYAYLIRETPILHKALKDIAALLANPLTTRKEPSLTGRLIRATDEAWLIAREALIEVQEGVISEKD